MASAGDIDQRLPPFVKFAKMFPGAFLKLERVQKLLKTLQAAEGKPVSSVESFVGLLQPPPTMQQILDEFMISGGESVVGRGESTEDGVGGGNKVEEVLRKLDKVMGEVEVKAEEDVGVVLERRLREFEDEVEMPREGRGGFNRLVFTRDVTAEAFVMFLAIFYHSVGESSTRKDD